MNETIIINTKKLYKYQDNLLLQLIFVARIKVLLKITKYNI